MVDWAAANLAQRAARDEMDATKCSEGAQRLCPLCGRDECGSALCEAKRQKAEQQARMAVHAALDGYGVDS